MVRDPERDGMTPGDHPEAEIGEEERRDHGFAMVMVLFIITMLAVLGATSLMMAAYSLMNAQGLMASGKAFDTAEGGISVAHAELARDLITSEGKTVTSPLPDPENPSALANPNFSAVVTNDTPGGPNWTITSTGTYTNEEGKTFSRTIEEKIIFEGTGRYFNAMDYVLFSESGTINISAGAFAGWNTFRVNGNLYGNNVTLEDNKVILGAGNLEVNGNVYARNNATVRAYAGVLADSRVRVTGGSPVIESLGQGVFANGQVSLIARTGTLLGFPIASARVNIDDNVYYGSISKQTTTPVKVLGIMIGGYITIGGNEANISTMEPVADVALPEPDFDWYRAQAKIQDLHPYDDDGQHYYGPGTANYTGPAITGSANINSAIILDTASLYNGWICFSEGNMTINNTTLEVGCKGVFVAMGNVTIQTGWWLGGNTEYQVIARGKVTYNSGLSATLNPSDTIFIYSGYESTTSTDYAVSYQLNWFRDIKGQITAKGSIYTPDGNWGIIQDTGITYRRPSVPVAGFPIPFKVLSWKVIQ